MSSDIMPNTTDYRRPKRENRREREYELVEMDICCFRPRNIQITTKGEILSQFGLIDHDILGRNK